MEWTERVRYFYEVVVSKALFDQVPEYIASNCSVGIGERVVPVGVDGMTRHLADVRKTSPDLTMTVIRQYKDRDSVISECMVTGTHQGEWLGMKPTGKKLEFVCVNIDRCVDGKIVEHSGVMNTFETLFEASIIQAVR